MAANNPASDASSATIVAANDEQQDGPDPLDQREGVGERQDATASSEAPTASRARPTIPRRTRRA